MPDREKLIELIYNTHNAVVEKDLWEDNISYAKQIEMEADILIANGVVIREKGRWLSWQGLPIYNDEDRHIFVCSKCKNELEFEEPVTLEDFPSDFCPNCGADMRGE